MHAPFKRQVERKVAPSEGLFSLRLPKFESYRPGILNSLPPCCSPLRPHNARRNPCRSCTLQRRSSDANFLCRAVSAKSAGIPRQYARILIPTDSPVRVRPPQPRIRSLRRRRPSRSLCLKSPVRETGPRGLWSDVFRVLALDRAPTVRLAMLWLNCRDGRRHRIREPSRPSHSN